MKEVRTGGLILILPSVVKIIKTSYSSSKIMMHQTKSSTKCDLSLSPSKTSFLYPSEALILFNEKIRQWYLGSRIYMTIMLCFFETCDLVLA